MIQIFTLILLIGFFVILGLGIAIHRGDIEQAKKNTND